MNLTVHLALVFHVCIAVAVMVMVCGRHDTGPLFQTHREWKGEIGKTGVKGQEGDKKGVMIP